MTCKSNRSRLRTKTGCLTCRQQKKKCDEKKPSCSDCSHYRRACIWPTVFSDGRHGKRKSKSSSPSLTTISSNSSPSESVTVTTGSLFKQTDKGHSTSMELRDQNSPRGHIFWFPIDMATVQEKQLFHHFSTCTMPTAIRAHAHPVYAVYKDVYQFGFQIPDVMNVFLGIAALRIGQNSRNSAIQATRLYVPSVNALCRRIRDGEVNGTEEWLLVLIAFMVIFETSRFDLSNQVLLHLGGLARLFRIRRVNKLQPDPQRPFHRIAAEAFTYHLATYSLLYGQLDCIAQQFTWDDLKDYDEIVPFPEASSLANSPILGSHSELFKLIFEITRLSRNTPLSLLDGIKAADYKWQLDIIQLRLTRALNFESEGEEHESQEGALLYSLTAQLFLFKVMNPKVDTDNSTVRHILSQALLFVDKCKINVACNTYFCWPLTILACAVWSEEGKVLIERKLAEIRHWIHSGQIHRTSSIIKAIWEGDASEYSRVSSGNIKLPQRLDRLIHKEGLADTLVFPRAH